MPNGGHDLAECPPGDERPRAAGPPLPGVTWLELEEEMRVYSPSLDGLVRLNATAADIWRLLDGRDLDAVTRAVAAKHGRAVEEVKAEVEETIMAFAKAGLISPLL